MKRGDLIIALALEGFGILVVIESWQLGLRAPNDLGPGFFPFLLGILLCLLALPVCISSLRDLRKGDISGEEKKLEFRSNLRKLGAAIACLTGYFLLIDILGFLITSFLFLFGLFWIGNPRKWIFVSWVSALVVVLAYLIFNILLEIPFPSGFF